MDTQTEPSKRPGFPVALLVAPPYLLLCWHLWFVNDDAYISFRYARNLADGFGLRYNLGDGVPVEGYSNFLWVLVGSGVHLLGGSMPAVLPLLSCLCGLILLLLLERTLRTTLQVGADASLLTVLLLAVFPPFAAWSSSGLETMPFTLLLWLSFDRLVLRERPDWIAGSLFGLLLAFVRLEGIAWLVVLLVLASGRQLLSQQRHLLPLLLAGGCIAIGFGAYFAWRYQYFGLPMPNTAYAKVQGTASLERGLRYLATFVTTFLTPLLLLPGIFFALRPQRWLLGACVATMAVAVPTYAVVVSGDFMAMGRLFVPGLPFLAVLLGWMLHDLGGTASNRFVRIAALSGTLVLIGLLPVADVHLVPDSIRHNFHFRFNAARPVSEMQALRQQRTRPLVWLEQGAALQTYAEQQDWPDDALACVGGMGAIGWNYSGRVFDTYGLVVPEIARRDIAAGEPRRSPGHDKEVDLNYMLRFEPHILWSWLIRGDRAQAEEVARSILPGIRAYPGIWKQCAPELVRVTPTVLPDKVVHVLLLRRATPDDPPPGQRWQVEALN